MKRDIEKYLLEWKNTFPRMPLLIRGARQVGKSYTVEYFGKANFDNICIVNFELLPNLKECFNTINPQDIINRLQLLTNTSIKAGKTLIFLDEIQECPQAILSLRYFKENMPEQHIIGAGSLMEFTFRQDTFRMPVGRVQFLNIEPLSFLEFLDADGESKLREFLSEATYKKPIEKAIHEKLLNLLRSYLIIGGMPEVIKEYLLNRDFLKCQHIQAGLLETYRNDFGKYANRSHHKYLQKVFDSMPRMIGQRIKYANIDRGTKSRDLKDAVELLSLARVIRPIYCSSASGLPLGAQVDIQKFKVTFLDIGLMQLACGFQVETQTKDIMQINSGAVAEQLIGQELKAYHDPYQNNQLYFWARDKRGSSAEVDYLFPRDKYIFPIEVKAGKTGTLKSLYLFMEQKKAPLGIRLYTNNIVLNNKILSLPLYMTEQISRLIQDFL